MKKIVSSFLCVAMVLAGVFAFTGCTNTFEDLTYDIVLITDGGTVSDGSYNESAWSGITSYAEELNASAADGEEITYRYYQPYVEDGGTLSTDTALEYIDLAVQNGAEFIVLPGEVFEVAAYEAARQYSDVNFILVDGTPHAEDDDTDAYIENVMTISFDTLQSGFLAGYYAVITGNTKLGYFGSVNSDTSSSYGAGFVQGAQYAADQLGIPVTLDYADYDSSALDYSYDFTITANYVAIDETTDEVYTVVVVNGSGSGTYTWGQNVTITADPAPEGMVFDHWECVSNTEGVKDSKVNISDDDAAEMNLLVEECDCTITAVYTEAPSTTYPVTVNYADGTVYSTQYIMAGESCNVVAPVAESGMVFDHWEISDDSEGVIDDIYSSDTWVYVTEENQGLTLTPVYVESDAPTFNVTVVTGEGGDGESTGSGSYTTGDVVTIEAALPMEGYIFSHWSTTDADGYSVDIVMDNEYYSTTTYTMVNRYQAIVEKMFNEGVTAVYAGGNSEYSVVSDATWNYSYTKLGIGAENAQSSWDNYLTTTIKDYGSAIKACLENFLGGYNYTGDCSNDGIYLSTVDEDAQQAYDEIYSALADGSISITDVAPGGDVSQVVNSNCFTLDYWVTSDTSADNS